MLYFPPQLPFSAACDVADSRDVSPGCREKIPAGFIITGPNIASQDLLFEQLAEDVRDQGRFVRMRAAEVPHVKAALKKIIRDATARTADEDEEGMDAEVSAGQDVSSPSSHLTDGEKRQTDAAEFSRVASISTMTSKCCTCPSNLRASKRSSLLFKTVRPSKRGFYPT